MLEENVEKCYRVLEGIGDYWRKWRLLKLLKIIEKYQKLLETTENYKNR